MANGFQTACVVGAAHLAGMPCRVVGAGVAGQPLFVADSGAFWHLGVKPESRGGEVGELPLMLPELAKGILYGVVSRADTKPWALVVWQWAVVLYNGFSGNWYPLWTSRDGAGGETFRLPELVVCGEPGPGGRRIRAFLVVKCGEEVLLLPQERWTGKQNPYTGSFPPAGPAIASLPPLPASGLCALTSPCLYGGVVRLFAAGCGSSGPFATVLELAVDAPAYQFGPEGRPPHRGLQLGRWEGGALRHGFGAVLSPTRHVQARLGERMVFAAVPAGAGRTGAAELYQLYQLPGSKEYRLWPLLSRQAFDHPILVQLETGGGQDYIAFIDGNDILVLATTTGREVPPAGVATRLSPQFALAGGATEVWAVTADEKGMVRHEVRAGRLHEEYVGGVAYANRYIVASLLCGPVLAEGRVFGLRGPGEHGAGRCDVTMEVIGDGPKASSASK